MRGAPYSKEKADAFAKDLGALVQRYLDMQDCDPLAMADDLARAVRVTQFIGEDEE